MVSPNIRPQARDVYLSRISFYRLGLLRKPFAYNRLPLDGI